MKYKEMGNIMIVRIDRGEEIITALSEVCEQEQIKLGRVSAIGAVDQAVIGIFEPALKKYHSTKFTGDFEITSLAGNITSMNGKPYIHLHINLADSDHHTWGGHLTEAIVSVTCEVIIEKFGGEVDRSFDPASGVNLLAL